MSDSNQFQERLGVICCGHVFRREREVKLVVRTSDRRQFMCGGTDHVGADGKPDGKYPFIKFRSLTWPTCRPPRGMGG
jgi:hypothetical protein